MMVRTLPQRFLAWLTLGDVPREGGWRWLGAVGKAMGDFRGRVGSPGLALRHDVARKRGRVWDVRGDFEGVGCLPPVASFH